MTIEKISRLLEFSNISKELGIPILVASQPSRFAPGKKLKTEPGFKRGKIDYFSITGSLAPFDAGAEDSASFNESGTPGKNRPTPSPKHYRDPIGWPSEDPADHKCEEGMTEIFGWVICKHCGKNLRKIK